MRHFMRVLGVLLCVVLATCAGFAQETTGSIQGTVTDPQGAAVPNAAVEASSPALIAAVKVTTDGHGSYRLAPLPPGTYAVTFQAQGFGLAKRENIAVSVGKILRIDVQLAVATVAETVVVSAEASRIDITQSKAGINIPIDVINMVPRGRNFGSILKIAPGVRYEASAGGFQMDGSSGAENVFIVDGINTTNMQTGVSGQAWIMLETVQEVQVKSSGYEAEYGGSLGGVVNVVTKTGGNDYHGEIFAYLYGNNLSTIPRPSLRLNPVTDQGEYFQYPKDDQYNLDVGFTVGGPIVRDKLTFFLGWMPQVSHATRTVNFIAPVNIARNYRQNLSSQNAIGRLTAQVHDKIRLNGSWNYTPFKQLGVLPSYDGADNPDSNWAEKGYRQPISSYSGTADFTVTNKLLISSRVGYFFRDYHDWGIPVKTRYQWSAPSLGLAGVPADLQRPSGYQTTPANFLTNFDTQTRLGYNADVSYFATGWGTHNLKAGYALNRVHNELLANYNGGRVMVYWNRTRFGIVNPGQFRGPFGYYIVRDFRNQGDVNSNNHALYFQDSWTIKRRLTLNYGLRIEAESIPSFAVAQNIPSKAIEFGFGDKLAPRFGASLDVLGNGRWKLFGSYAHIYDVLKYEMPRGSFGGDYWHDHVYTLEDPNIFGIVPGCEAGRKCPGKFIEEIDWRIPANDPSDNTVDPKLKPMKEWQVAVGSEFQMGSNFVFATRYLKKRLVRTIEDVGTLTDLGEKYYIANPGFGVAEFPLGPKYPRSPKAKRNYDALEFRLDKRMTSWFAHMNYTYSRLRGNYSGLASSDEDGRTSPNVNRYFDLPYMNFDSHGKPIDGALATDRPHSFKAFLSRNFKSRLGTTEIGPSFLAFSGTPVTTEVTIISSIPIFVENRGDKGRTASFTQTDLYFKHDFPISKANENLKIRFDFNIENLFNQKAPLRLFQGYTRSEDVLDMTDDQFFKGFDWKAEVTKQKARLDARYLLTSRYQSPVAARFGIKFIF